MLESESITAKSKSNLGLRVWWSYHKLWILQWWEAVRSPHMVSHMLGAAAGVIGWFFIFFSDPAVKTWTKFWHGAVFAAAGYCVLMIVVAIAKALTVSANMHSEQRRKVEDLQKSLNGEISLARKATAEFIRRSIETISLQQRLLVVQGEIEPKKRELAGVYEALATCQEELKNTENMAYDRPISNAVLYIAEKLEEEKDTNYFPKTLIYMRQLAANGNLTLWGRKQLDPGRFKIRKFSDAITAIPKEYWAASKLTAGCVAQEYAATIPCTMPEQIGCWPSEANAFSDIHVNWAQIEKLM